ncbi:MAG: hypothetical protein WC575_04305 [Patescibacteria group bacterium]
MSTKLWVSIVLIALGLIGIFTLADYWQMIAVIIMVVGLIMLIMVTVGAKRGTPPPTIPPAV